MADSPRQRGKFRSSNGPRLGWYTKYQIAHMLVSERQNTSFEVVTHMVLLSSSRETCFDPEFPDDCHGSTARPGG